MARMGVAFVRGLQGDDPKYLKAVATPKHFAGNNSEYNRHDGSSDIDEQLLHEYYLPAFEATVRGGRLLGDVRLQPASTACRRPPIRCFCTTSCATAWGFKGYVVSDCDAVCGHRQQPPLDARPRAEAAAKALLAGTDLNCGTTYPNELQAALDQGLIAESDVDIALTRVLRARFLLGEFDPGSRGPLPVHRRGGHRIAGARGSRPRSGARGHRAAQERGGLLPLDRATVRSIAVIGPHGNDVTLGGYSGNPDHTVSALDGIRAKFPAPTA